MQAQPEYGPALCVLGLVDAALWAERPGLWTKAVERSRSTPLEKDVSSGSRVVQYFALIATLAGEKELALQQLEIGLRAPVASLMPSYGGLKLHPLWDPLRGDPRFGISSPRSAKDAISTK